jgi:hypothetical protein
VKFKALDWRRVLAWLLTLPVAAGLILYLHANGGHLHLDSTPGHGTTITGRIPTHQTINA